MQGGFFEAGTASQPAPDDSSHDDLRRRGGNRRRPAKRDGLDMPALLHELDR